MLSLYVFPIDAIIRYNLFLLLVSRNLDSKKYKPNITLVVIDLAIDVTKGSGDSDVLDMLDVLPLNAKC